MGMTIYNVMNKTELMNLKKETDALAEAYTVIDNLRSKLFYEQNATSNDTSQFLGAIATQINLYRVAIIESSVYKKGSD